MRAVVKILRDVESIQAPHGRVEGILVAEVVVAKKNRILVVDNPVCPQIQKLRMLHGGRRIQQIGRQAKLRRRTLVNRVGRRQGAQQVLVASEYEKLVFDQATARVDRVIVQIDGRRDLIRGQ